MSAPDYTLGSLCRRGHEHDGTGGNLLGRLSFDFTDPEQVRAAFAPENHQWLPMAENRAKGCKLLQD